MKKSLVLAIAFVMLSAFNLYAFSIVNITNYQTSTPDDGTWNGYVIDDTNWNITDDYGYECMSLEVTSNANNMLRIDVVAHVGVASADKGEHALVVLLFDAFNDQLLAVQQQTITFNGDSFASAAIPLTYFTAAGGTRIFKVRIGVDQNDYTNYIYFNRSAGGTYGDKLTSSITVTEFQP